MIAIESNRRLRFSGLVTSACSSDGLRRVSRRGGVRQDIQIRIQQRQAETQREVCPLEEVARARSYIKMATAQILGIVLHEQTCGASPHEVCKQDEYQQVIHSEEPTGIEVLTCVCGIRGVHL